MKVIVVGATGTIGRAVVNALADRHDVISVSRSGDIPVDYSKPETIAAMYERVGRVDAVISVAGDAKFGPLDALADEDFAFGLGNKLMGQINLVRYGRDYLNENGSITLTSGILADQPHAASVLLTTVNAGVEGFVRAAALGLTDGKRLNVVSPPMVKETAEKLGWGDGGVPASLVARAYVESVEGNRTGEILYPLDLDKRTGSDIVMASR